MWKAATHESLWMPSTSQEVILHRLLWFRKQQNQEQLHILYLQWQPVFSHGWSNIFTSLFGFHNERKRPTFHWTSEQQKVMSSTGIPHFIAFHRYYTFFMNWRQDPPTAERLTLALLWWSGTKPSIPLKYACTYRVTRNRRAKGG